MIEDVKGLFIMNIYIKNTYIKYLCNLICEEAYDVQFQLIVTMLE